MAGVLILVPALGALAAWLIPIVRHRVPVNRYLDSGESYTYKANTCEGLGGEDEKER